MGNEVSKALQLLTPKKNTNFFYGFLPRINKEYFDDGQGESNDLKLKPSSTEFVLTGSMDTSAIDAFRQGVEITRSRHFDAGTSLKIHAGEPGGVVRKNSYGYDRNFRKDNFYSDIDYFDPVDYLTSTRVFSYPIITGDNDETENYNFNGVIEPLTIRALVSFFSIDVPFEAHDVKANLEDGNSTIIRSNDRIKTVRERNENRIVPWLDMIDMVGEVKKIPTMGYFNDDRTFIAPFNDQKYKLELSSNLEGTMLLAAKLLNGSTDNYVADGYISATAGWTYDDVTVRGTDSIAFGGFGY